MQHILGFSENEESCLRKAKMPEFFSRLRELNIALSLKNVGATPADVILVQAIHAGEELEQAIKQLSSRLKEWYGWHSPLENPKNDEQLCKAIHTATPTSQFTQEDIQQLQHLATLLELLKKDSEKHEHYINDRLQQLMPATVALATPKIAAKLLCHTGSLHKLALMSSSTIQLLGAEKALFRHLATGAKSPKYGFLIEHPVVQQAQNKGREARKLAGKIAIACRTDFFRINNSEKASAMRAQEKTRLKETAK